MRTVLILAIVAVCPANSTFGTWEMNAARSTFTGSSQPKSLSVRIEPHAKGEVFTLDRVESDGRATTSSSILYLDGAPRDIQDFDCAGAQSSRLLDSRTLEIRRNCAGSDGTWVVRQSAVQSNELIIDITEKRRDGANFERRVVLPKQEVKNQ
jgi:hypothetical protein